MANDVVINVKAKDEASRSIGTIGMRAKTSGGLVAGAFKLGAAGMGIAAVAGIKLLHVMGDASQAAREANKVHAQTTAVLKSTKGAADVSAKSVADMAGKLSMLSGVDDEVIQSGENMLLTFTNIRNGVGKGNDIFDQATKATLDLSVAMGKDMSQSAVMVGKALNDPIKGITALKRVGVTFNAEQEKTIKHLVETGKTAEAQKIILKELRKEFGGSAKAQATWADKAKVAAGNVQEAFGTLVNKGLEPVAKWFVKTGAPVIQDFFDKIGKDKGLKKSFKGLSNSLADFVTSGEGAKTTADSLADSFIDLADSADESFKGFNKANHKFASTQQSQRAAILKWRITMLEGILSVAEAWGKISPQMRTVAAHLRGTLARARADFNQTTDEINRKKIEPKIRADIRDLQSKVRDAKQRLRETHNQKTQAKIRAEIGQLRSAVAAAKAALRSVHDKTVWIRTHRVTYYGTHGKPPTNPKGDRATGGYIGGQHAAEGGPRGGGVWVGEQGPELVDLPLGSHVNSNPDSMAMAGKGSRGGGPHLHFHFDRYTGSTTDLIKDLVNAKKRGQLDVLFR